MTTYPLTLNLDGQTVNIKFASNNSWVTGIYSSATYNLANISNTLIPRSSSSVLYPYTAFIPYVDTETQFYGVKKVDIDYTYKNYNFTVILDEDWVKNFSNTWLTDNQTYAGQNIFGFYIKSPDGYNYGSNVGYGPSTLEVYNVSQYNPFEMASLTFTVQVKVADPEPDWSTWEVGVFPGPLIAEALTNQGWAVTSNGFTQYQIYSPSQPTNVTVTPGDPGSYTFAWEAPANTSNPDDGIVVNQYRIYAKDLNSTDSPVLKNTIAGDIFTSTVTGLDPNKEYLLYISAFGGMEGSSSLNSGPSVSFSTVEETSEATAPIDEGAEAIPGLDLGIGSSPTLPPEITVSPIVTDPDGTLKVCLKNALGETVVCGKLPEGSDTPALITVRKDNNYIFVMYQGKIIITYEITEANFPTLYNSLGWVNFWDKSSGFITTPPVNGSYSKTPLTGYSYSLFARDLDAPIGYSHPLWLYGRQYQSYSIMFDEADNIRVEQLPIDSELNNSFVFYRGGHRYDINNKYANLIANAGYMRWLEVIDV